MITCDEALLLISARLDGALSDAAAALLAEHLAGCGACRALLADFEAMEAALPQALEAQPPAGLKDDILAAVRASKVTPMGVQRRKWRARSWASLAAVLAIVLLGAGVLRLWQPFGAMSGGGNMAPAPAAADSGVAQYQNEMPQTAGGDAERALTGDSAEAEQKQTRSDEGVPGAAPQTPVDPPPSAGERIRTALDGTADTTAPEASAPLTVAQTTAEAPRYCGILIFPYDSAPRLEDYPSEEADGAVRYRLPAGDFAKLAEQAGALPGVQVVTEGEDIDPDAETGLVILDGAPS